MKPDHIPPQPDENFFPALSNKRKDQMSDDKRRNSKTEEHTTDVAEHRTACLTAADATLACAY